jgi:hypothetical protein
MERDEESGLSSHGARYYVPQLARWTSCDPEQSLNRFTYGAGNPIALVDRSGLEPTAAQPEVRLSLGDILRAAYLSATGPETYADLRERYLAVRQEEAQANAVADAQAEPGRLQRGLSRIVNALGELKNEYDQTRVGKATQSVDAAIDRADASLKETAQDVGRGWFDTALGGVQASQQMKLGPDARFYTTPGELGKETGGLAYEGVKGVVEAAATIATPELTAGKEAKFGSEWSLKWIRESKNAAAYLERNAGVLVTREVPLYLKIPKAGGVVTSELVKTGRIPDALVRDLATGRALLTEWSTTKELEKAVANPSTRKALQLALQTDIFAAARANKWSVWAKVGDSYIEVTNAEQIVEAYPHFRPQSNLKAYKK